MLTRSVVTATPMALSSLSSLGSQAVTATAARTAAATAKSPFFRCLNAPIQRGSHRSGGNRKSTLGHMIRAGPL
ncbi:hypothetical protein GCM10010246_41710 [Streptomyces cuspidosporus]|uniref:Secreted protein n=1 Tax=Streptomyces cuspidosporus TaxID=66882 RepID=A0ABP5TCQ3_9ACTN